MRNVMSGLACPSRRLMVTMSTPESISCEACVWRSAWNVTSGMPMALAKSPHAELIELGERGSPSKPS